MKTTTGVVSCQCEIDSRVTCVAIVIATTPEFNLIYKAVPYAYMYSNSK